jgi:hypothetical protein
MTFEEQLKEYVLNPYNQNTLFNLGIEYEIRGQIASAITFYTKATEYGFDEDLTYEALIRIAICYDSYKDRPVMARGSILNAIIHSPNRPEAYWYLSILWEKEREYQESYVALQTGENFIQNAKPLRLDIGYRDQYIIPFQKAIISWWTDRFEESKKLTLNLFTSPDTPEYYIPFLRNNLINLWFTQEEVQAIENQKYNFKTGKIDIVLQGQYNDYVDELTFHYLNLPFVNNIIISYWQGDNKHEITHPRIKYVKSPLPNDYGTGNRNLQIVSSLAGLKAVETEFAIKMRNDQKFTFDSMMKMYSFYQENKERVISFEHDNSKPKNRICVAGNFTPFPFHPRDHVFFGNTEDLIDLFDIPLDTPSIQSKINIKKEELDQYYDCYIRSESYIGSHYCSNFDTTIKKWLLTPEKYLYDNALNYNEAKSLSDKLTPQIFKSFPKEGIDLEWPKYGWNTYPYKMQQDVFGEYWHEDGV